MTSKELDPRVFEDYKLIIYDPETLAVKEMLLDVPKGASLATIKNNKEGFSFGFYKGEMPSNYRKYRFVNGNLIRRQEPYLFLEVNTPFYLKDSAGYLIPIVLTEDSYTVTIKSVTTNGRVFTHDTGKKLRLTPTQGTLNNTFISNHKGKSSVILSTKNTRPLSPIMIKCESKSFGVTHLEMFTTTGTISDVK
jgi:hypothetical protein